MKISIKKENRSPYALTRLSVTKYLYIGFPCFKQTQIMTM